MKRGRCETSGEGERVEGFHGYNGGGRFCSLAPKMRAEDRRSVGDVSLELISYYNILCNTITASRLRSFSYNNESLTFY